MLKQVFFKNLLIGVVVGIVGVVVFIVGVAEKNHFKT